MSRILKINWPLVLIVVAYLIAGGLYASYTPVWQAPDEPAHYNYIHALAVDHAIPIMEFGDYDQAYISRLTSEGFPPDLSVAPLEYEDHQPPLYYLIATPVYWASGGSVIALRFFSLLLGGSGLVMLFLVLRESTVPSGLAWLGTGVVAFIPQYLAITAAINNDALTLSLLWLWLWFALRYLQGKASPQVLGGIAGALLLTKTTGYGVLLLAIMVVYLRYRRTNMSTTWLYRQYLAVFGPAFLIGGIWWIRNLYVYGWPDFLGLRRHSEVVIGQPRTADWISEQGLIPFLRNAARTTFRSFWGQFGWMGVVLDTRIYQAYSIFSLLAAWGALGCLIKALRGGIGDISPQLRDALILMGTGAAITVAMYVGYNLTFVQHQGRYLFAGLPLYAIGTAYGLKRLLDVRVATATGLLLAATLAAIGVLGMLRGDLPRWLMAMLGAAAIGLPLLARGPSRWHGMLAVFLLAGMWGLDLWCLFGFIVPMLS